MDKVNIADKLSLFTAHWSPKIVGGLNGQEIKLVKIKGEFVWHKHEHEDEMFFVLKGSFIMQLRDRNVEVKENEFVIVPRGVEHCPLAEQEAAIMLFEPAGTAHTGNVESELTEHIHERL